MFKRLLIANRGEIAVRIIKAAQKLGIETVAVYSEADKDCPYLKSVNETVCIGPSQSANSYLNMEAILQTALQYDCQAIHPGFGFLAENSIFAALCEQYKISFIGPSPSAIKMMGDKALARETMQQAGLPIIPGSEQTITELKQAQKLAQEIGFPILLKATAGGGGKGIRICTNKEELKQNFEQAKQEAQKSFGNPELYIEKYIEAGRHIEFQILADNFGNVVHLGERECSVQRNHQKLLEEAPSAVISPEFRTKMGALVTKAVAKVGYQNAGTIEFLMDKDQLYFMEMNTRLQVEHPVTELITGIDIVQEQIKIAANNKLKIKQEEIKFNGHAIECRINAEDPDDNFKPKPGKIVKFKIPEDMDDIIRIDTFIEEGVVISPFYDSMICKLIAFGDKRNKAIENAKKALNDFTIEGVPTTIPLHLKILEHENFKSGNYDTGILKTI